MVVDWWKEMFCGWRWRWSESEMEVTRMGGGVYMQVIWRQVSIN